MLKQLAVALTAALVTIGSAVAAQGGQPAKVPGVRLLDQAPGELLSRQKARSAPAGERRSLGLVLPARPLPSLAGYRSRSDRQQGGNRFLWGDAGIAVAPLAPLKAKLMADSAARSYLGQQAAQLNVSKRSIADAKLLGLHDTGQGPVIARYQQQQDGIAVFGKRINVMMDRGMKLVASSGHFASTDGNLSRTSARSAFSIQPEQALALAFADLSGESLNAAAFSLKRSQGDYSVYATRSSGRGEIRLVGEQRSRKFWYPLGGELVPAWYAELHARSQDLADTYAVGYLISARDGRVLFRKSLIDYDAFSYRVYADASGIFQPLDGPLGNGYAPFVGTPGVGNTPRVAAPTSLVTLQNGPISTNDPWLPAGATESKGNNVDAYLDLFGTADADGNVLSGQGFDPGTSDQRAVISGANSFDYPYTPDADPTTAAQRQFAVVDLFYLNNWLHDWWYDNGFDEAAGNAQADNYGRGGVDDDVMLVEAQDFSGRNNANMSTPPDGGSPRMQQYLFDGRAGELTITPDASVGAAYQPVPNTASFGPTLFDQSGEVVATVPANGCTALTNGADVAGKVAIVDRGACTFKTKTLNAQNAGAIAVILHNNQPGLAPSLADDANISDPISIGTLSVTRADGQKIRADGSSLPVTARVRRLAASDIDSAIDAQIVAHEWFHYTSNRLVGDAFGLTGQQGGGMGEGWSDFSGLMLTVRPEDRLVAGNELYQGAYPQSIYSAADSYFGIRRAPYSTSFDVFPMTFKHIEDGVPLPTNAPIAFGANGASNSEVHNTGEIWANTLWEIYASLLNDPRYSFLQAQDRMKSYIIAGLKMTPDAPTLLDARDALLAAAYATDAGDFELMATAFAKRGMGVGAVAPSPDDDSNSGVVESFVAQAGGFEVVDASLDFSYFSGAEGFIDNDGVLDPGETALLSVTLRSTGTNDLTQPVIAELSTDGAISFGNGGRISFPASPAAPVRYGDSVTGTITVTLRSAASTARLQTLTISFPQVGAGSDEVIESDSVSLQMSVNYDLSPARTADDIEQPLAAVADWSTDLIGSGSGWAITDGDPPPLLFGSQLLWLSPDNGGFSDLRLTTPALQVGDSPFSMSFEHYFQFEFDYGRGDAYDGGVIEISTDNGATWTDVIDAGGRFTAGEGYNGSFLALGADGVPTPDDSGGHDGFVANNFADNGGFLAPVTLSFGRTLAGQTVRLRFRQVSDAAFGEFGWAIDNVSFAGVTNLPFRNVVDEDGVPDNRAPVANAGADGTAVAGRSTATLRGSGTDPDGDALSFAWTQVSGPAPATIANANQAVAQAGFTAPGTYVFRLTVTDVRAVSASDTVSVVTTVSLDAESSGGALGVWLLLPGLALAGLRRRRRV